MPTKRLYVDLVQRCRKILKEMLYSYHSLEELSSESSQLLYVLKRTVDHEESDSVLVTGPPGCGKTTLVNEAVNELKRTVKNDFVIIKLNGLIHIDDTLALKDIVSQLNVDLCETNRVSNSFAENLQFLIESLRVGSSSKQKAVIFILEEFHLFCSHKNQTLLYNLFDSTQSTKGVCVVGVTCRLDVTEMLEKRVKSRFSHRQLLILKRPTLEKRIALFKYLLTISNESHVKELDTTFIRTWNLKVEKLCSNEDVIKVLKRQLELDDNEAKFRSFMMVLVSRLTDDHDTLNPDDVISSNALFSGDDKIALLQGLSVLEICLVIAMSHQNEIYDGEPFNFEMIISRYLKFANQSAALQMTQRPVILKAFERIKNLELICPISGIGRNAQKEFQLCNFLLTKDQVISAVQNYTGIPTDVLQWAASSIV